MKPWSPTDIALLREHYPDKTGAEVAILLNRKASTVHQVTATASPASRNTNCWGEP